MDHRDWPDTARSESDATVIDVEQPHSWRGLAPIETDWDPHDATQVLLDPQGKPVPYQVVPAVDGSQPRIAFVARVANDGKATYRMVHRPFQASLYREVFASETEVDNVDLRLELDARTGMPASLIDRRTCDELLGGPGWAGGALSPSGGDGDLVFHAVRTACVERGPVRSTLRSESCLSGCRLVQEFRLWRDLPWVEVNVTVTWDKPRDLICLGLVTGLSAEDKPCSAHASVESPSGFGWRWVDLSQPGHLGIAMLHGPGASAQVCGNALRLEVRRNPPDASVSCTRYALLPHAGDREKAGLQMAAALLNSCASVVRSAAEATG